MSSNVGMPSTRNMAPERHSFLKPILGVASVTKRAAGFGVELIAQLPSGRLYGVRVKDAEAISGWALSWSVAMLKDLSIGTPQKR